MASYFNLILDTLAPVGLTVSINSGAAYTTSEDVVLNLGVTDPITTGYQIKVWGIVGAATEVAATWEPYSESKSVKLVSTDGLKTVSVKIRDDVGNESATVTATITLDSTTPVVTISNGPDRTKLSKVVGFNMSVFAFTVDSEFVEYKVKVVPAVSSLHTTGTLIPILGGSINTSDTGTFPKTTPISVTINGSDLATASSGEGSKIVKVFVKDKAGLWSEA